MTRAKHRRRIPWRGLRRLYRDLLRDHHELLRAHRALQQKWADRPGTSWGAANMAADTDATVPSPVIVIGQDGVAEVVSRESR